MWILCNGGEVIEAKLPRKASREELGCPYPKPTQVGWLSRLRWTR